MMVRSDLKGRVGWRLTQHLIDYARAEGLEELYGHVLAENTTMLGMCRQLGFTIAASRTIPACGGCGSGWVLDEGEARRLCRSGRDATVNCRPKPTR